MLSDKIILESALDEIKRLEKQNIIMRARLDVFDKMMSILPRKHEADVLFNPGSIIYNLEKRIEEMKTKEDEQ